MVKKLDLNGRSPRSITSILADGHFWFQELNAFLSSSLYFLCEAISNHLLSVKNGERLKV